MMVNGISSVVGSAGASAGTVGMNQASDPVSKDLLRQIDEAKKKLQELSSSEDMSIEEKMKKRQELQKQISDLNSQLRQHQIELRREATTEKKQQKTQGSEGENLAGNGKKPEDGGKAQQAAGLSQGSMQAMISADGAMKQAKVQGSVAKRMEGKAGVLEAEIKLDSGRGWSTERKEEELAEVENKAANASSSQMDTLSEANETIRKAKETDRKTARAQKEEKEDPKDSRLSDPDDEPEESLDYGLQEGEEKAFIRYSPVDVRL